MIGYAMGSLPGLEFEGVDEISVSGLDSGDSSLAFVVDLVSSSAVVLRDVALLGSNFEAIDDSTDVEPEFGDPLSRGSLVHKFVASEASKLGRFHILSIGDVDEEELDGVEACAGLAPDCDQTEVGVLGELNILSSSSTTVEITLLQLHLSLSSLLSPHIFLKYIMIQID